MDVSGIRNKSVRKKVERLIDRAQAYLEVLSFEGKSPKYIPLHTEDYELLTNLNITTINNLPIKAIGELKNSVNREERHYPEYLREDIQDITAAIEELEALTDSLALLEAPLSQSVQVSTITSVAGTFDVGMDEVLTEDVDIEVQELANRLWEHTNYLREQQHTGTRRYTNG